MARQTLMAAIGHERGLGTNYKRVVCLSQGLHGSEKNTTIESNLGRKGFISVSDSQITLHHPGKSKQELKQGRDLEVGADAEDKEGCYLLAGSLQLVQPAFL